jgi:hypothetical protein
LPKGEPDDDRVPAEANVTVPESSGPENILRALGRERNTDIAA